MLFKKLLGFTKTIHEAKPARYVCFNVHHNYNFVHTRGKKNVSLTSNNSKSITKMTEKTRRKNLTDLKVYPNLCSAWATCESLDVKELHLAIINEFSHCKVESITCEVGTEVLCVENLSKCEKNNNANQNSDLSLVPRLFIFDFGCFVFWNVDKDVAKAIRQIAVDENLQTDPYDLSVVLQENDTIPFVLDKDQELPKIQNEIVKFPQNLSQKDAILYQFAFSNSLALSLKLAHSELDVDSLVKRLEPFIDQMRTLKLKVDDASIMKIYGDLFHLDHQINLSSDFLEVPEIYWNQPLLENAFLSMRSYLGVKERVRVLGVKITQSFNLLEMLRSHLNENRSHHLERLIIILIAVEILIAIISGEKVLQVFQDLFEKIKSSNKSDLSSK